MNTWEYLPDVPAEIRATMAAAFVAWEKQDLGVEAMVEGMIQCPAVTRATVQTLQSTANAVRVPELVRVVKRNHPGLSWRDAFKAAGLFCGLHHKHVQKLFYFKETRK